MAWTQRWDKYFDLLDADNSGFISIEDVAGGVALTARAFNAKEGSPEYAQTASIYKDYNSLERIIDLADADKDGKVTREEFRQAAEKIVGGGVEKVPAWFLGAIRGQFKLADSNQSGDLSLDEMTALIKKNQPGESDAAITNAYNWALHFTKRETTLDEDAVLKVFWVWAASPEAAPEAEILLPYFRKPSL